MAKLGSGATLGLCVLLALLAGQLAEASYSAGYGTGGGGGSYDIQGTVRKMVQEAIRSKPSLGPALVRLLFHDCWVSGCDASVLLDNTPYEGSKGVEKKASKNIGLDGFDLIDDIKRAVGENVSCADILVFAARDAAYLLSNGNIAYTVSGGRKDGVASSAEDADATLPGSTFSFGDLEKNFYAKNFTVEELVILSGAHSAGVCHKSSFEDRLIEPSAPLSDIVEIDPKYRAALEIDVKSKSYPLSNDKNPTEKNNIRDMDYSFKQQSGYDGTGVNQAAVGVLDNSYYTANLQNMVLLKSDWALTTDKFAKGKLIEYKNNATDWNLDFSNAMAKLSKLPHPAGKEGKYSEEIRKNCRVTNKKYYY